MAFSLLDKTSNANNLTNNGATEYLTSLPYAAITDSAQVVAGSTQYLTAADSSSLSPTSNISIEFWMYLDALASSLGHSSSPVGKWDASANQGSWEVYTNSVNDFTYFICSSNGSSALDHFAQWNTSEALTTGGWHHFAITFASGTNTCHIYVDTVDKSLTDSSTSFQNTIFDSTIALSLGCAFSNGTAVNLTSAKITDVRIWNIIRSSTDISNNWKTKLNGNESGLVAYWPFDKSVAGGGNNNYSFYL